MPILAGSMFHSSAEALWWAREFGVTADELRDAVRRVGQDPRAVWLELVVSLRDALSARQKVHRIYG